MVIADLDVIQLDFRGEASNQHRNLLFTHSIFIFSFAFFSLSLDPSSGDNVDCWMEIQHGKGPWAPPVSGIVPLGSTLTLVVAINDFRGNSTFLLQNGKIF